MLAQYVGFTVPLTNRIRLIERRTRAYDRLKPEPIRFGRCRIKRQVRTHAIHELFELVMIVNEYQLNSADPKLIKTIEQHMRGYLFHEGEYGTAPEDFVAK